MTEREPTTEQATATAGTRAVLDTSAVLALLFGERGGENVAPHLDGAILPAVNLAEVLSKVADRDPDENTGTETIETLTEQGVRIETVFSTAHAAAAARLGVAARHLGLSFGDRACLAVTRAKPNERYARTADEAWAKLPEHLNIGVVTIR
jgi:PIN domain nuclease of toxin-antitoxin system